MADTTDTQGTSSNADETVWGHGITNQQMARASFTISHIDTIIERRKRDRFKNAGIMKLQCDEYQPAFDAMPTAELELDWIKGAARVVFEHCIERGLNPTIECIGWAADTYIMVHWQ